MVKIEINIFLFLIEIVMKFYIFFVYTKIKYLTSIIFI